MNCSSVNFEKDDLSFMLIESKDKFYITDKDSYSIAEFNKNQLRQLIEKLQKVLEIMK